MSHRTQSHLRLSAPRCPGRAAATAAPAAIALAALAALLAACGSSGPAAPAAPSAAHASAGNAGSAPGPGQSPATGQAPVPAESNPPGDIPDTTVYVPYQSAAGHFQLRVPESWSRSTGASSLTFSSNLNSITAAWMLMAAVPSVRTARSVTIPALRASTPAFRLQSVRLVPLPGGTAIEIVYQINSPPNSVTGKQYRLVIERFEFQRGGRAAVLSLSSAVGSDNVDPWRIVSESFRWA
jgi:hypothetical protein